MFRFLKVLASYLFPIGIWLAFLGYEWNAFLALIVGWSAILLLSEE